MTTIKIVPRTRNGVHSFTADQLAVAALWKWTIHRSAHAAGLHSARVVYDGAWRPGTDNDDGETSGDDDGETSGDDDDTDSGDDGTDNGGGDDGVLGTEIVVVPNSMPQPPSWWEWEATDAQRPDCERVARILMAQVKIAKTDEFHPLTILSGKAHTNLNHTMHFVESYLEGVVTIVTEESNARMCMREQLDSVTTITTQTGLKIIRIDGPTPPRLFKVLDEMPDNIVAIVTRWDDTTAAVGHIAKPYRHMFNNTAKVRGFFIGKLAARFVRKTIDSYDNPLWNWRSVAWRHLIMLSEWIGD